MRTLTLAKLLAAMGILCILTPLAFAQTATTGQVVGVVSDPSGAVVAGAQVLLSSDAGVRRETSTSDTGRYTFAQLEPGGYVLEVNFKGFAALKVDKVIVKITETTNVDIRLRLATQQNETVTVQATPPLVQTENPARGTVIEQTEIRQLPLPTRNFQQLLTLTPGTSGPVQNSSELGRGAAPIYVNGLRSTSNSVIINGTDANSIGTGSTPNLAVPATDSLEEFIVQTSQYDASQGRVAGGIVAAVTKSGTDEFHGNLYEFFRNDALNANNFFLNRAGVARPPYKRNQFGGTLGGPLVKSRAWFFLSYQGSRERNSTSLTNSIGTVFVPGNLSNDRSDAAINALAASFGVSPTCPGFPGCLDPTAKFLLQAKLPNGSYVIPSATNPGTSNAPVAVPVVGASKFREDQFNTNLDYQISAANRFSAKFFDANNPATQGLFNLFGLANSLPVPGFGGTANLNQRVLSLNDVHIFSPRLVNEAHFGFGFISTGSAPQEPFTAAQAGITSPLGNLFPGMPEISVANYFDVGANPFSDNSGIEKTYTAGDTLSWHKGGHSLKFGVEYKHHDLNEDFNLYTRGQIFFLGFSGNPFTDFLGGFFDLTGLTIMGSGVNNRDVRAQDWGGFMNDDWRVTSQLTLTLGVRYDYFGPFTEAQGRFIGFDPARLTTAPLPGFPAGDNTAITGGFIQASNAKNPLPGIPLVQSSLVAPDKNNFAPRVGFAWQPLSNSKRLVVRGGYGVYYDRANSRLLNNQLLNFPYSTLAQAFATPIATPFVNVPQPSSYPLKFDNPAVFPFGAPPAILTVAPTFLNPTGLAVVSANGIYPDVHNFRTPYIQQYSLGFQDEFANNWLLDVSYVGSAGRKLYRLMDVNQALAQTAGGPVGPYSPGLSSLAVQGFGVHLLQSSANSNYNSLQIGLTKRFSYGLQFLTAYTYSHSLDDYSGDPSGTSDISVVPGDETVLHNRASSDFDRRHRLVFSGIYDLPKIYNGDSRIVRQAANGWELASILTLQSGTPFSVLTNATAFVQARADAVAGCHPSLGGSVESRLGKYFNTSCFTPAPADAAGGFGDTGRNILRGPNQRNVDISVIKYFPITEQKKIEFRAEFFNAFNMVSFANPVNLLASANVGQIVATTTGPRVIQFALKYTF
jgi:hypothetical protein